MEIARRNIISIILAILFCNSTLVFSQQTTTQNSDSISRWSASAVEAENAGDYEKALDYYTRLAFLSKSKYGSESDEYGGYEFMIANCYRILGNFQVALEHSLEADRILKTSGSKDLVATCYFDLGYFQEAKGEWMSLLQSAEVADNPLWLASYHQNIANCEHSIGNLEGAVEHYKKSAVIQKNEKGEDHDYALTLYSISWCLSRLNCNEEALDYAQQSLSVNGEDHNPITLSLVASLLFSLQNYEKSLEFSRLALKEPALLSDYPEEFIHQLWGAALCSSFLDQYEVSLSYYMRYSEMVGESSGRQSEEYIRSVHSIGDCFCHLEQIDSAIVYYNKSANLAKQFLGEQSVLYASSLFEIGACYEGRLQPERALECFAPVPEILRENNDPESVLCYINSLLGIGGCHRLLGSYEEAITYYRKAADIAAQRSGYENFYLVACHRLLEVYTSQKDGEQANRFIDTIISLSYELFGGESYDYASTLLSCCLSLLRLGMIDRCRVVSQMYEKATTHLNPTTLDSNDKLSIALIRLALKLETGSEESVHSSDIDYVFQSAKENVYCALSYHTKKERERNWRCYQDLFTHFLPVLACKSEQDVGLNKIAYNSLLIGKGFLLNAESEVRQFVLKSQDSSSVRTLERLTILDRKINDERNRSIGFDATTLRRMMQEREILERGLIATSSRLGDYRKNLFLTWQDVQENLGKRDMAIEFFEFPVEQDSCLYYALTLKKHGAPKLVKICSLGEMQRLNDRISDESKANGKYVHQTHSKEYCIHRSPDGLIYTNRALFDLVWGPLLEDLTDIETVYFSPVGELHQIAIEYAETGSGPLNAQKDIHRLSSTRELVIQRRDDGLGNYAILFGGLQYDNPLEVGAIEYQDSIDSTILQTKKTSPTIIRGGKTFTDLQQTKGEVQEISSLLKRKQISPVLFTGVDGTEKAFKSFSGKGISIAHIATHGFFWNESQSMKYGDMLGWADLLQPSELLLNEEDWSMTRTGLAFSGANIAFSDKFQKTEDEEDGVLTANEIASLDFHSLDLLVLSACQTGLGEISGDGVFGLQRGFKMAGAGSILMSLWEVNDEATRILMTSFYKHLLQGKSKTEALKLAQREVRKNPQFDCPYYWAAFIMLD